MVYLLVSDEVRDKDLIALVRELRERDIDSVEVLARRLYDLRWDDRESKNTTSVEHLERVLGVMAFRFD